MAVVAEFISVLRKIRDVIYPEVNALYEDSLVLKEYIDVGKAEIDADLIQFNTDYSDFNTKKKQVDLAVASAQSSATSANNSAIMATNKSNEIKAITVQSTTGAPETSAYASYNPTDGKFTFVIPQGSKGNKGESFTVNSSGITAQRELYNAQPAGWSFLDITTSTLYFKVSNTSGDWSSGVPFGKGDKGDIGDTGVGITSFTFVSTTDISGLPAKSGATDTYRVTLTNETTFDYNIYNGLDYSQELLDNKVALTGNQTIEDVKTFTSNIVGNITGNSVTATKLQTVRTINGVDFDGSANISVGLDAQSEAITTSFTLDTTHKNKLLVCANGITITLPNINTMKSGDLFYITNGDIVPLTLALNGNSTNLNTLKVTKGEILVIQSDGGAFYRCISRGSIPLYDFDTNLTVSLGYNAVFRADVDLTLVVICTGGFMNGAEIVIGTTTSPTRVVARTGDDINSNNKWATLTAVITAGLYFKVQGYGEHAFETIEINAYKHK